LCTVQTEVAPSLAVVRSCENTQTPTYSGVTAMLAPDPTTATGLQLTASQLVLAVLSSSVAGAVVVGVYSLRAKRSEYVNDYYKTVVARRIAAYEKLERLILELKTGVVSRGDPRPYHLLLSSESEEDWQRAFVLLGEVMAQGLWLSNEVYQKLRDFNHLIFRHQKPESVIEFGRQNYEAIATRRSELERLLARDMLNLHDVKRFLKRKDRLDPGFSIIKLNN
jgi:hypothetical protein